MTDKVVPLYTRRLFYQLLERITELRGEGCLELPVWAQDAHEEALARLETFLLTEVKESHTYGSEGTQ